MKVTFTIRINRRTLLNTLLYADDQVIVRENVSDLQSSIYSLVKIVPKHGVEILTVITRVITFGAKISVRSKISDTIIQFSIQ